ncbi:MAG TPA: glycoside hydrolase family 88 protein [Actinomycetes bacterium]|nr:glycoside hydrolase family 88 protein [Actinomycetes bacterium]
MSERVWRSAEAKLRTTVEKHPGRFPLYTEGGAWALDGQQWTRWGDGFLGGALWLVAAHGEDRVWFRQQAERYTRLVEGRKADDQIHDHGFLFWPTYYRWYQETQDPAHLAVLVEAARTLAGRFREPGRYLPSFLGPESLFIDIMMNVHLVLFAASVTGDRELARIGHEHSLTTRRFLIRGDGSASHAGVFDVQTGAFIRQTSQQGFADDGSWARGQAWAIHGFGTVYRFTGDRRYLATAVSAADFYLESTGDRLVPPNDWTEPEPARPFESSAAAAAAAGLWQLAGLVPDAGLASRYADYAARILVRLSQDDFLASPDEPWEGVLKHGSYHEGLGLGVDESLIFGDYWFLAAVSAVTQDFSAPRR